MCISRNSQNNFQSRESLRSIAPLKSNIGSEFRIPGRVSLGSFFLQKKLRQYKIETNQVHFRNDKYTIFKKFVKRCHFPNMDAIENKYLVLPVHLKMSISSAKYIAGLINRFT